MVRAMRNIDLLNELTDEHRLYVVRDEEEEVSEQLPRERLLEELRDVVFRLREAEERQRA